MFYIKYLTMHKVHMHAGAIRQLLYDCILYVFRIRLHIRMTFYKYLSVMTFGPFYLKGCHRTRKMRQSGWNICLCQSIIAYLKNKCM